MLLNFQLNLLKLLIPLFRSQFLLLAAPKATEEALILFLLLCELCLCLDNFSFLSDDLLGPHL